MAAGGAAALAGALAIPAAGAGQRVESFAGSCEIRGDVTFTPRATNEPGPLQYAYAGSGTCTGTLGGREVSAAPAEVRQSGRSHGSCAKAETTEPGRGELRFASGEVIAYTLEFTSLATEVDFTFTGARAGTAQGRGTFLTDRTPPDLSVRCRNGGVDRTPLDVSLTTDTPLESERPAPAPAPAPAPDPAPAPSRPADPPAAPRAAERQRFRIAVSPRRAPAGRRTVFTFRVRTARGKRVAGAAVSFAGRRARTGRRGRARIAATLHRRGQRSARVTKDGFAGARATVRIR